MNKWLFSIFILLTEIFVVYSIGPANAQCPPVPTACNLYDAKGSPTNYSLEILPINNVWPIPDPSGFKWLYKLNGLTSINQMVTLAPDCCPATTYKTDGGAQVLEPGLGDPTTKFGLGDYQDWVIRLAAVSGQPQYYFYTDKLVPNQKTTVQIKSGNSIFYCKAIAGPGCPGEWTSIAVATNETITLDNGDVVCLKRHPLYPCPIVVDCATGAELESKPIQEVLQANVQNSPSFEQVYFAGVPGQDCPKVVLRSALDSPNSTWVCSGGRCYYK